MTSTKRTKLVVIGNGMAGIRTLEELIKLAPDMYDITVFGAEADYDRLLLATGSNPFMLPVPGRNLPGVVSYRDIKGADEMIEAASRYRHAVVIGGGLLGLKAANGLKLRGMNVTVVHLMPWLIERQLDRAAANLLQKSLEAKGLKFRKRSISYSSR